MTYVLDACALITLINKEEGTEAIATKETALKFYWFR